MASLPGDPREDGAIEMDDDGDPRAIECNVEDEVVGLCPLLCVHSINNHHQYQLRPGEYTNKKHGGELAATRAISQKDEVN